VQILIAIACAAVVGCYSPTITQCQFKCGSGVACPSTTSCVDGECLTSDGVCPGATCTVAPPPNCNGPVVIDSVDCASSCTNIAPVNAGEAMSVVCVNGWRPAVLDTAAKLANAPTATGDLLWVGAHRSGNAFVWSSGVTVDATAWAANNPSMVAGADCVLIDASHHLQNRECGFVLGHHVMCDHD
jgi:hypothetical protein